jgi:solute carrier family 50 protein (sugar transporter)
METKDIFGWAATYLTALFYVSLVTPFIKIFKGQMKYQDAPIFVIYVSYINCILWIIYGSMIFSSQIRICNIIGASSTFILIFIYLSYEIKKYILDSILSAIIVVYGTFVLYNYLTIIITDKANIIGNFCIFAKFCVFISPIQLIYRVIKEKNYILIPIYASFVSFSSGICWVIYGFYIKNIYVILPNMVGIILGITQFYVFFYYKKNYSNLYISNNNTIHIDNSFAEPDNKEDVEIIIKEKNLKNKAFKKVNQKL